MSTMSSSLLEFILDLLSNDDEMQKFEADSERYVMDAGFAGCAAEVEDGMKVLAGARPATMTKSAGAEKKDYDDKGKDDKDHGRDKDYGDKDHGRDKDYGDKDHGDKDYGHRDGDVQNITNNYNTHNGDSYDIEAKQAALNGGVNVGEDVEGDLNYHPNNSFNEASVGGDGVAAANGNAEAGQSFNTNGSGVQQNGPNANYTPSKVGDIDVDANVVVGDNNDTQQQSDDAEQENEGLIVVDNPDVNLGLVPVFDGA
jgi:hypothetical protein